MENKYYITEEQYKDIKHYTEMFEHGAESIKQLCKREFTDMEYGFELGEIHNVLRNKFIEMQDLVTNIQNQNLDKPKNKHTDRNYALSLSQHLTNNGLVPINE